MIASLASQAHGGRTTSRDGASRAKLLCFVETWYGGGRWMGLGYRE